MLVINSPQMARIEAGFAARLAGDLAARLLPHFPVQAGFIGEAAFHAAVAQAFHRAGPIGCTTVREAGRYALLALLLGSGFADDPRHPWAAEWLAPHPGVPAAFRLDRLLDLANAQLDAAQGEDNRLLVRSLIGIRRLSPDDFAAAGTAPDAAAAWLRTLLPGWAADREGATLQAVAAAAPALAGRLGLAGPQGVAVAALHAAMLGHGFAADPLYPWAAEALAGPEEGRPARLFAASLRYMEAVLA